MHSSSYPERDFAFGQAILNLRTTIEMTQAGLAQYLGVSRRAVGDWENGNSYPKADNLKQIIALALEHQAFEAGREAEEIRALWEASRQKLLLDEVWLAKLLRSRKTALPDKKEEISAIPPLAPLPLPVAKRGPKVAWGDAPSLPTLPPSAPFRAVSKFANFQEFFFTPS